MILPPDFEQRTLDAVRKTLDDIPECSRAEMSIVFEGSEPRLRIAFGDRRAFSRPMLKIGLLAQSRQNPLAPGRLVPLAQLQKHVREWAEDYFKIQGTPTITKVS